TEVLALALESTDAIVILDDALARQMATTLAIRFRGSVGLLLDAKQAGLVSGISPLLGQFQTFGFHLNAETRKLILAHSIQFSGNTSTSSHPLAIAQTCPHVGSSVTPTI